MNKNLSKFFCTSLLLMALSMAFSQSFTQFSQYIHSQGILNPAYTGTKNAICGVLLYRDQWIGIEGSPKSMAFNIHAPVRSKNIGIGLSVINEQIGMKRITDIDAAFSYIIKTGKQNHLSFGLQAGINSYSFFKSEALLSDPEPDPFFSGANESYLLPDFGFGSYYYTNRLFIGLSLPKLLSNEFDINENKLKTGKFSFKEQHIYLYSGYVFKVKNNTLFKPSVLTKYIYGAPVQFDISANFLLKKLAWIGLGYRTGAAMILYTDFKITDYLNMGYSYDFVLSNLGHYTSGTHEIRLTYNYDLKVKYMPMFDTIRDF